MSGRSLPHSVEAEEYLLSCCLLDGADVVARCLDAKIAPGSFYMTPNGILFEKIVGLHERKQPIDIAVVAEELKASHELDQVGGYAFLSRITGLIPTTAQVGYFIERVREQALLREIIRSATNAVEDCYNHSGDVAGLIEQISKKMVALGQSAGSVADGEIRGAMSFQLPPENDPNALLGSNRYIGRGDSAVIVSSAGMGKSTAQTQWAVHCALGLPFMGIATKGELKSLIVQAEDSDGDVGEQIFSCAEAMRLTESQRRKVNENVVFVRDKVNRGAAFISRLAALVRKVKPDLVWLNPLHAFAGCDIANATELGAFLRGGLNAINHEDKFAYMIVHHTPKPITGKGVADKKWHEFMYDAAGSAELVNWARAIITIKPTDTEGDFNLVLAKRGKRAGVKVELPGNGDGVVRLAITTKVPMKHSNREVKITGREKPFQIVYWESRKPDAEEAAAPKAKRASHSQFQADDSYRPEVLIVHVAASGTPPMTYGEIYRSVCSASHISKPTLTRRLREMQKSGLIKETEEHLWVRTAHGDNLAAERLREVQ